MSAQLVSVPLTLNYLGTERFGVWATLSSLLAMLAFADLGIGNGLLNAVSAAHGRDDVNDIRCSFASALAILSSAAAVILLLFGLTYPLIDWPGVFNVASAQAANEVGPAAAALVLCVALNVPATAIQRLQLGLQMGFVANVWQGIGSVLALASVMLVIRAHGSLASLVLAFAGVPVLAAALNGFWFFKKIRRDLLPRREDMHRAEGLRLLRNGTLFFVLQIVASVTYLSDALVIAHVLGAGSVASYAVPEKLFALIAISMGILVQPLWPAYAEAISKGDSEWVRATLFRSLRRNGLIATGAAIALFFLAPTLIRLWTGHDLQVPLLLLASLAIWKVVESLGLTISIYLNGSNLIRPQLIMAIITAVVAIALKFWLIDTCGVAGTTLATLAAYVIFSIPIAIALVRRSLRAQQVHYAVPAA